MNASLGSKNKEGLTKELTLVHRVNPRSAKAKHNPMFSLILSLPNSPGQLSAMARLIESRKTSCCPRPRSMIMRKNRADHSGGMPMLDTACGNVTKTTFSPDCTKSLSVTPDTSARKPSVEKMNMAEKRWIAALMLNTTATSLMKLFCCLLRLPSVMSAIEPTPWLSRTCVRASGHSKLHQKHPCIDNWTYQPMLYEHPAYSNPEGIGMSARFQLP